MKYLLPAAALLASVSAPVLAQRPPSTQEQIVMLQQQLAASQASASSLAQRLDAVERQLQQLINQEEQNGHRVSVLESGVNQMKSDSDSRMNALEQKVATLSAPPPQPAQTLDESTDTTPTKPVTSKSKTESASKSKADAGSKSKKAQTASATADKTVAQSKDEPDSDSTAAASDPGEDAYSAGYHLWADGDYAGAVKSLTSFTAQYPNHKRVSWARNLIGRALLEEGQPRAAAEAFLANYRSDPGGGRAQDSLYYLGQSLMKLNQPGQACKAYAELESVYGSKVRPDIKSMLPKAKADAGCQ
jgi:TolA-binding protein